MNSTIAVFGGTGSTGRCFVNHALEKGYKVRMLARNPAKVETKHVNLTVIEGDFSKPEALASTIRGAECVVSMAGAAPGAVYPTDLMLNFVTALYPLMEQETSVKHFLYQAGVFCEKPDGSNPFIVKLLRPMVTYLEGIALLIADHERVMVFLDKAPTKPFTAAVVRPGKLIDGPVKRTLVASEKPRLSPVTYGELAAFNLIAMNDTSLVGKYPFVN